MAKVKPPVIRVKPGLSVDFVGSLRKQVNAAVLQAQKGVKPIIIRTIIEAPSRRQLANISQAPVGVPGVVTRGAAPPAATTVAGNVAATQERINASLARGAVLLGGVEVAEKKVASARRSGAAAAKQTETRAQQQARAEKFSADASKRLANAQFVAATKSGDLAQAKSLLAETSAALSTAEKGLEASLTKTTRAVVIKARADREAALAAVQALEADKTRTAIAKQTVRSAGGVPGGVAAARRQASAQLAGINATHLGIGAEKQLAEAEKVAATRSGELAKARSFLTESGKGLTTANQALKQALRSGNIAVIEATDRTKRLAAAQKAAAKAAADEAAVNAKSARTSARSSEQLTRGGQASLLSLAGIRGATLAASRSFLVGAAAITVFAKAVKSFADLEQNLHVFQATAGATAQEMENVREQARLLGADLTLPGVSAGDAAGAMVELAKAGLTVQDSIAGARGVLELATAAAIDNAAATQIVANALNAFGLAGRDAIDVADTFANAANLAQGSIADIGTAFQQAAAAGRQVGLSFQDTSLFLTVLAKNGLRGSDAGTSLRTALIRLINPSKEAAAAFEQLGIEVFDATGNLRPDVFIQIADATKRLTPAMRNATIALIGGQDAFRAITILGRQSISGFIALRRQLREEGTAARLAEARTRGLHGAVDALGSVLETVGTSLGGSIGPGLANFTRGVAGAITAMSESDQIAETLSDTLTAVGQGFNLVGSAASFASPIVLGFASALQQVVSAIGVSTILAAVAAYKLLPAVLGGIAARANLANQAVFGFGVAQKASILTTAGMRAALIGAATSFNLYAIAAAAAIAGIVFLATRESDTERATRHLTEANKDLATALDDVAISSSQQTISSNSVNQAELNVLEAQRAAAAARVALADSTAAKGSIARRRAELLLAVAIDNVQIAEQRASEATRTAETDRDAAAAAAERLSLARDKEIKSIDDLIAAQRDLAVLVRGGGGSPREGGVNAETLARQQLIQVLGKQAAVNRTSEDEGTRQLAKRQQLFVDFTRTVKAFPNNTQKNIIFNLNTESAIAAARQLRDQFLQEGDEDGAKLVEGILLGMGDLPKALKDYIDGPVREGANAAAARAGAAGGFSFTKAFADAMRAAQKFIDDSLDALISKASIRAERASTRLDVAAGTGAGTNVLLKIAQDQLAAANKRFALARQALGAHQTPANQKEFNEAAAARRAAFEQVQGFLDQIDSDAKQAAGDIKSKADDAAKASEEATQAFLDSFDPRKQTLENRITSASFTPGLQDDIKRNQILLQFFKRRIELIRERIRKMHLHGDALKAALAAIRTATQDIFNTKNEINKLVKEQADARFDLLLEKADLRIRIAEANSREGDDNTAAILKARRRKLSIINKEIHRLERDGKKNTKAWLELKAQQAEERRAIDEVTKETKNKNDASAQMQFEFLQTQAGFAANLLGNLIPTGFGAGTVGGTTAGGTSGGPVVPPNLPPGVGGGGRFPGALLPQEHGRGGGPSPAEDLRRTTVTVAGGPTRGGQVSQTQLLHQIRHLLQLIYKGTGHPEAKHRQRRNIADMDLSDHH